MTPSREPLNASSTGVSPRKTNKACVPCRTRKVRCDAAVVGLPCSSCRSRQCTEDCLSLERKGRTRKRRHVLPNLTHTTRPPTTESSQRQSENQSTSSPSFDRIDRQSTGPTKPNLLYLQILNDAVDETVGNGQFPPFTIISSQQRDGLTLRDRLSARLSRLNHTDREYLEKKGVVDLPPSRHLDLLVMTYFDHVHPFSPVIDRDDFTRSYYSGGFSLLLLYVMLTTASLHADAHLLSDCGFADRSAAQASFFSKAKLLHDFAVEDDLLASLQGSIILCMVILEHPTDHDFGYWFHNAVRLATKLDLRKTCIQEDKPRKILNLYRRIWLALCAIDTFHVSVSTERSLLLDDVPEIKLGMEDLWEDDELSASSRGFLLAITFQQRASIMVHGELSRMFRQCLSIVTDQPRPDPWQMMRLFDGWRKSLSSKMKIVDEITADTYELNAQVLSYRFECILYRQIRRQSENADWIRFAKQRLQSTMLELNTVLTKVLFAGETFLKFPIFFITTVTTLLALHIESAIDPSEPELVRSMAQTSISQVMLILAQERENPAIKRALPIFRQILTRHNLCLALSNSLDQSEVEVMSDVEGGHVPAQQPSQDNSLASGQASPQTQISETTPQPEQWQNDPLFNIDFLGFEFSDQWQQF